MEPRERNMTIGVAIFGIIFLIWRFAISGMPSGMNLILSVLVAIGTLVSIGLLVRDWLSNR